MKYSVVIPCYNSEKFLEKTIVKIREQLADKNYEIILVNDYSKDQTFSVIKKLSKQFDFIIGVDLAKNMGQHNATMAGFRYASGDYIMTCADDGQSPIELWPQMIDALDNHGYDVASVEYINRGKRSLLRKFGSYISSKMDAWLIDRPDGMVISFEFMAKKFVVDEMVAYHSPYGGVGGLIYRVTWNIKVFECDQHGRDEGSSGYTLKKLISLFLNQSTAFSIKPLRVASVLGCISSIVGFVFGLITLIRRLYGAIQAPGFSTITILLLIGFGLNLMVLGLIGEYIGRIYMVVNKTPQYVVRRVVRNNSES